MKLGQRHLRLPIRAALELIQAGWTTRDIAAVLALRRETVEWWRANRQAEREEARQMREVRA